MNTHDLRDTLFGCISIGNSIKNDIITVEAVSPDCTTSPNKSAESTPKSETTGSIIFGMNANDCSTPIVFSQRPIFSQQSEIVPLSQFRDQLRELSQCLIDSSVRLSLSPVVSKLNIETTRSRTSIFESPDDSPETSRRQSLDNKIEQSPSFVTVKPLPDLKDIIHTVYTKMRIYMEEEIQRRSSVSFLINKTPAKIDLGYTPICPPLKRVDRRRKSPSFEDTEKSNPSKKNVFID